MSRKRRKDRRRVEYPPTGSALGEPTNAERLARALAILTVGDPLSEREVKISVELAHFFSGAIADLEDENRSLHEKLLELIRMWGV